MRILSEPVYQLEEKNKSFSDFLILKTESIFLFCGILILRLLSDFSYSEIIYLVYGWEGYSNDPNFFSQFISWVFLASLFPLILKIYKKKEISFKIIFLLTIISLIPTTSIISFNSSYPFSYVLSQFIYWILLLYLSLRMPSINLDYFKNLRSNHFLFFILFITAFTVLYSSWSFTGFRFFFNIFDSAQVYEIRVIAREYSGSVFLGYLLHLSDNLLPILMVYMLWKGYRVFALIIFVLILLNFGITATKQLIFSAFIGGFGYFFIKNHNYNNFFILGTILLLTLAIIEFYFLNTVFLTMLSTYRIFFIPANFHYYYFEFIRIFEPDYFRQSFLRFFIDSPYEKSLHFLLADFRNGDFGARANVGLFSDAFMNLGYVGLVIFPFLLITYLKLLDGASQDLSPSIKFIICILISVLLLNLNFTIALISGGLLIMLPLIYSLPRK